MRQYADTFKARMVRGMLGPNAVSARATTTRTPPTGGPGDGGACHHTASRAAIEKVPVLAALMPQLQAAHAAIFALRAHAEDPKVRKLSERQSALDDQHDQHVRGLHTALTGVAMVSGARAELLRLRDTLLPEGLAHSQKTYRGQAGHGAMT